MNLGRFTLGQFVPIDVTCVDGDSDPAAPTRAPTVKVYSSGGTRVISSLMPPLDRFHIDGLFCYRLQLGDDFSVGRYMVSLSWVISGTTYHAVRNFEVVAGGDADGAIVSLCEFRTPVGTHLVQRLDSAQRVLARGPTV